MKTLKLEIPEGYEIDKENSTFENIILKKIEKKLPLSVREIEGKHWYEAIGDVTSKERAEAFLALMQLVELRDAWNKAAEESDVKFVIRNIKGKVITGNAFYRNGILCFKTPELRDQFLEQFRDLIETAKELI